jgi:hypothetical protein
MVLADLFRPSKGTGSILHAVQFSKTIALGGAAG